ncbi:MAG: hypothetical protein OXU96_09895, partial [Gammaproteobacteria bacterium]|nr:hypothetical protein [Gammaproteobacteria bacterium]
GTVAGISPTVTIAANDPVTFRIESGPTSSESNTPAQLSVTLDPTGTPSGLRLTAPLTIPYRLTGTATSGMDYTPPAGQVVIPGNPGSSAPIEINIIDDDLNEADETIIITLDHANARMPGGGEFIFCGDAPADARASSGAYPECADSDADAAEDDTGNITIDDNDAVTATFASTAVTANEGETVRLTLNLDNASSGAITAAYTVTAGGTNTPAYTDPGGGSITIPAGQTSGEIVLYVNTDPATDSGTGTLTVNNTTLTANYGGGLSNPLTAASANAVVTVTFRPTLRNFSVAADSSTATEGGSAAFTVSLAAADGAPTTSATVAWSADGADVPAGTGGTVTLSNGGSQTVNVAIPQDNEIETTENLTFTLAPPAAGFDADTGIATGSARVTVSDDDLPGVVVSPTALNVPEGGAAAYSVRLTAQPGGGGGHIVTITPSVSSGNVSVAAAPLAFTDANWNRPQAVVVTATDTAMRGETATVTHTVSASGGEYSTSTPAADPVAVTIVPPRTAEKLHRAVLPEVARAVVGSQMSAIAGRAAAAGGAGGYGHFNLNGASTMGQAAAANIRALAGDDDAGIDWKDALRDMDFVMPLNAGHGGGGGGEPAFWGGSEYRDFAGEDGDTDWDGDMLNLHAGFDAQVRAHLRAGLMLSYGDSESDYSTADEAGEYEIELTTVSPYLNWQRPGHSVWVSVGYGAGEVEVRPDNDNPDLLNDVNMWNFGAGGVKTLNRAGEREVRIKADVFSANAEIEGDATGGVEDDIDIDVRRVRVAMESRRTRELAGGAQLTRALELGARHDGGDGSTGGGMELGGALYYRNFAIGLSAEAHARYLIGHSAEGARDWSIGGHVRLDPGADGQGLAVSLTPAYGATGSGTQDVWNNSMAAARNSDAPDAAAANPLAARIDAEIGYGVPVAWFGFGDGAAWFSAGLLTPYSALRAGDDRRDYRLGVKWSSAARLDLDLSARRLDGDRADNLIALEARLRF